MVGVVVGRSVRVGEGVNVEVNGVVDVTEADDIGSGSSVRVCRAVGDGGNVFSTRGGRVGASDRASVGDGVGV
jgi:hypothetical protein